MKKALIFILLTFPLIGCSRETTYSLKEAAGFDVSNITVVSVSQSVYMSMAWPINEKYYSYFETKYIKVDFDIHEEFLSSWPPSNIKDDAYCLHVQTDVEYLQEIQSGQISYRTTTFYISHKTRYMYFYGLDSCYRSNLKMSYSFIKELNK